MLLQIIFITFNFTTLYTTVLQITKIKHYNIMKIRNKTAKNNCQRGGGETRFRKFLKEFQKKTTRTSNTDLLYNTFKVDRSRGPSHGIQLKLSPFIKTPKKLTESSSINFRK